MTERPLTEVEIYTDGGCEPNPGVGGWAAVLIYNRHIREICGSEVFTTNNRMELTAAIEGLQALKRSCRVRLYTDSEYVKRGISEWLPKWKRNQWRRGKHPVKNQDLWEALDIVAQKHDVHWMWVRGHAGNRYNERCDQLADEAIRAQKRAASSS